MSRLQANPDDSEGMDQAWFQQVSAPSYLFANVLLLIWCNTYTRLQKLVVATPPGNKVSKCLP